MKNYIKELRDAREWSQDQLAKLMGTTNQQVGMLERGQRRLSDVWIEKLCKAFEIRPWELFEDPEGPIVSTQRWVWGVGDVNAGEPREALEWPMDDWVPVPYVDDDERWPDIVRRALRVVGDSMNKLYAPGSWVFFVHYLELDKQPEPGENVVALQHSATGFEATLKQFHIDEDGQPWLVPQSTNLKHQPIMINQDEHSDEGIEIVGRVVGSFRQE